MESIFSPSGQHALLSWATKNPLLAFDYDGTLAKIVSDATQAFLTPHTSALLSLLALKYSVFVLSGRSREDLVRFLPANTPFILIGNHGLEGLQGSESQLKIAAEATKNWVQQLLASSLPSLDGILIENKTLSVAVHYRHAALETYARQAILEEVSRLSPRPRVVPGKKVINLVLSTAPHKGNAVQRVMEQKNFSYAVFIGDDDTDEDAFALQDERILTIRVGMSQESRAQYYLQHQSQIDDLLTLLLKSKPEF